MTSSATSPMAATSAAMLSVLAISSSSTTPCSTSGGNAALILAASPLPGDPADARAHGLDRGHQRIGQRHRPEHVEAELRARLGIGGDAARVVVGDAGDEARPDPRQRMLLQAAPKEPEGIHARRDGRIVFRDVHEFHFRRTGGDRRKSTALAPQVFAASRWGSGSTRRQGLAIDEEIASRDGRLGGQRGSLRLVL